MRPDSWLRRCALLLTGLTILAGSVVAAAPEWRALDSRQRALIQPALQSQGGDFDKLSESRRAALVQGANRWLAMTPAQRNTATQQFQQWQQLSREQKVAVLERRERFRKMTPEQRKALLETQKQFLEMPLQQQTQLQDQFKDLQPGLDGLTSQPLTTPGSPTTPGTTAPLGLPATGLPSSGATGVGNGVALPVTR